MKKGKIGPKGIRFQLITNPRMTQPQGEHLIQNNWTKSTKTFLVGKILINHPQFL